MPPKKEKKKKQRWFVLGGWMSCHGCGGLRWVIVHNSILNTETYFPAQGYLLFYWAGHHNLFPHTHCWRLLVKEKSPCANIELNRSSVSFNFFSRPPIGSFLLKYRTAVTQSRGLFARLRQTHKDQRFKVEWFERQMSTLWRRNIPR